MRPLRSGESGGLSGAVEGRPAGEERKEAGVGGNEAAGPSSEEGAADGPKGVQGATAPEAEDGEDGGVDEEEEGREEAGEEEAEGEEGADGGAEARGEEGGGAESGAEGDEEAGAGVGEEPSERIAGAMCAGGSLALRVTDGPGPGFGRESRVA